MPKQELRWVMLMPNLPGKGTTERVKIWRRLQTVGAVAVRPAVYVLPRGEAHVETFQWLAKEIAELGGQASLCEGTFLDETSDNEIVRKFLAARTEDYGALEAEAREASKAFAAKIPDEDLRALEGRVAKLRRRLDEVVAIDFHEAPARRKAEAAVVGLEKKLAARRPPAKEPERLERVERPTGATWVTRSDVHIDRIACSWLIVKFIDPAAKLKFVASKGYVPQKGELRFDMYDAEHTHVGDRCTFEVLLARMGLDDPGLAAIGELVHDIDVRDEKFGRPETEGLRSQMAGVSAMHHEDLARIAAATPIFEALHAFYTRPAKARKVPS